MSFIQKSFSEISKECFARSVHSEEPQKEMKCNLNAVDVTIIFTRMHVDKGIKIPNRINVCPNTASIIDLFKKHLHQLDSLPNEDKRLWVFQDYSHVNIAFFQYELRFFADETALKSQLAEDVKSKTESSCAIL